MAVNQTAVRRFGTLGFETIMKTCQKLPLNGCLVKLLTAMKRSYFSRQSSNGFTLIELLVVIAIIAILAGILMPVLAAAKARALQAECINNTKELGMGWQLYANDNQDYMVPNSPYNNNAKTSWCPNGGDPGGQMDWGTGKGNTNVALFDQTILAPYMSGQLDVYRCPADNWPSQNGFRIRDYSMQGQVGNLYCKQTTLNQNPDGIPYIKLTDLHSSPGPSDIIVFLEEHPNSLLNAVPDGYLEVDTSTSDHQFPDVPGSNHHWGAGMSFADGHSEMHNWLTPALKVPVTSCISDPAAPKILSDINAGSAQNYDWYWFTTHCSAVNPNPGH
jgi:prepilin-type N-terminal cleavage/methylation domain-containing protein